MCHPNPLRHLDEKIEVVAVVAAAAVAVALPGGRIAFEEAETAAAAVAALVAAVAGEVAETYMAVVRSMAEHSETGTGERIATCLDFHTNSDPELGSERGEVVSVAIAQPRKRILE